MSQPEPNLTVVIPVHNAAPHLGACVESLLAQSYTDFELILVENGSSDDSRERCARYAAEHPGRIRTLTLDEASVSAARNAGIDNARGRFITFMDADDWAEKEFLAEFFRDPAPGPGTIVMQGILLDFSEAEPPGPNEAFFSYDDGALAIGDDPSAAVGQRFLQDGCSVCKLYHTETLRRLGIRFIEHLCSREDHLFFFTCISRMQSVVWRSGLYMHYMRRGRNTLSTRPMPACELVEDAERISIYTAPGMEYNEERCKRYVVNQAGNAIDACIQMYGLYEFERMIQDREVAPNPKYEQLIKQHKFDVLCQKVERLFGEKRNTVFDAGALALQQNCVT